MTNLQSSPGLTIVACWNQWQVPLFKCIPGWRWLVQLRPLWRSAEGPIRPHVKSALSGNPCLVRVAGVQIFVLENLCKPYMWIWRWETWIHYWSTANGESVQNIFNQLITLLHAAGDLLNGRWICSRICGQSHFNPAVRCVVLHIPFKLCTMLVECLCIFLAKV